MKHTTTCDYCGEPITRGKKRRQGEKFSCFNCKKGFKKEYNLKHRKLKT